MNHIDAGSSRALLIWMRSRPLAVRIGVPVVLFSLLTAIFWPSGGVDLPTAVVQSGEFVIDLKETGRLRAENSVFISAPPARSNLQIIGLVDEGTLVKEGDFLIQFDTTEVRQQIDDAIADLDIAKTNYDRTRASADSRLANLESSLENNRASYRLAELRLDQLKFEADVRIEEGTLQLKQAKNSLDQAVREIEAQRTIDEADLKALDLKVKQSRLDLEQLRNDLAKLTIRAPRPGLVVYKETWRGGEMSKIKVGDSPWRGQALIELPDLTLMLVATTVSELDVGKVKPGLECEIKLEAYPDPVFHGEVLSVGVLARADATSSEARSFDVLVRIRESDPLLRPGMSASVRIIVDRLADRVSVPIEAVFARDGDIIAYVKSGNSFRSFNVKTGPRNDNFVVVEEGIRAGMRVALVDPTVEQPEPKSIGGKEDKATPEPASSGSQSGPGSRPRGQGGGRRRG